MTIRDKFYFMVEGQSDVAHMIIVCSVVLSEINNWVTGSRIVCFFFLIQKKNHHRDSEPSFCDLRGRQQEQGFIKMVYPSEVDRYSCNGVYSRCFRTRLNERLEAFGICVFDENFEGIFKFSVFKLSMVMAIGGWGNVLFLESKLVWT
jgi:hypothetical protein